MSPSNLHTRRPLGFTMIEMLVTLSITIVLMLFVGQIFSQVSDAAKSGIAVSHVIENARIITGQMSDDAANMIGPSEGGFLIIETAQATAALDENDPATRAYNMDHVAWVRLRGDLEPMIPANDNSYSNSADDATYVRVFYGHGRLANTDGTSGGNFGVAGLNQYSSQWVMARNALFLDPTVTNGVYATGIGWASTVSGGSGDYWTGFAPASRVVGHGVVDVAKVSLADVNAGTVDAETVSFGQSNINSRVMVGMTPSVANFEGWRIGQLTPLLASGVSDIIVEHATAPTGAGAINWQHTDLICTQATSNWPDLIRIRFRVHGVRGNLNGIDGEPGVMFERIIRVKK